MSKEKIEIELVEMFLNRFGHAGSEFYLQKPDGKYGGSYRPLKLVDVGNHLVGAITIGFPTVNREGLCKWICFDDDQMLPKGARSNLDVILAYLRSCGYHCFREGARVMPDGLVKQGHLWLLLEQPMLAKYARVWGQMILAEVGIAPKNIELFPKQDSIISLGNCVRGPLGRHAKDGGKRGWFAEAPKNLLEQLAWLEAQPLNPVDRFIEIGKQQIEFEEARNKYKNNFVRISTRGDFDGPTVLEMVQELGFDLIDKGDRYRTRCPVCAEEGHDDSEDNLDISKDEEWFGCWYNGWNEQHKPKQIYKKLIDQTKSK